METYLSNKIFDKKERTGEDYWFRKYEKQLLEKARRNKGDTEKDFWETPDGNLFLQVTQNALSDFLRCLLRILRQDAFERVSRKIVKGKTPPRVSFNDALDNLPVFKETDSSNDNVIEQYSDFADQYIPIVELPTDAKPKTDISCVWSQEASDWMWKTSPSGQTPFSRFLLKSPKLKELARLRYLKGLQLDSTSTKPTSFPYCSPGKDEYCFKIPDIGLLIVGPLWTTEREADIKLLPKKISRTIEYAEALEPELKQSHSLLEALAYRQSMLPVSDLWEKTLITGLVLSNIHILVQRTENGLLHELHVSEWIGIVQFILFWFVHGADPALEKDSYFKKIRRYYGQPWTFRQSKKTIGIHVESIEEFHIDFSLFRDQKQADGHEFKKNFRDVRILREFAARFHERATQNQLSTTHQRLFYFHTQLRRSPVEEKSDLVIPILHRIARAVEADAAAFYSYDQVKEELSLDGLFVTEPYSGTRQQGKSIKTSLKTQLKKWYKDPKSILYDCVRERRPISRFEGSDLSKLGISSDKEDLIAVPAFHMGRVFGVFLVYGNRHHQFRHYTQWTTVWIEQIVSPYLFRSELIRSLGRLFSQAKECHQQLHGQENHDKEHYQKSCDQANYDSVCETLAGLFSSAGVSIWLSDREVPNQINLVGKCGCFDSTVDHAGLSFTLAAEGGSFLEDRIIRDRDRYSEAVVSARIEFDKEQDADGGSMLKIETSIVKLDSTTDRSEKIEGDTLRFARYPNFNKELTRAVFLVFDIGRPAMLVLHDREGPNHCPRELCKLIGFVAQYVAIVLRAMEAMTNERVGIANVLGHDVRQQLVGIETTHEKLSRHIETLFKLVSSDPDGRGHDTAKEKTIRELRQNIDDTLADLQLTANKARSFFEIARSADILTELKKGRDPIVIEALREMDENFHQKPPERPIDVGEVLNSIARTSIPGCSNLELTVMGDERLPPLWLHPLEFELVFRNLIDNAGKYANPKCDIRMSGRINNEVSIEIDVANTGKKIEGDEREEIFRLNARGRSSEGTKGEGKGLYLARAVARSWGGDVRLIESPEDQDTPENKFRVTIPFGLSRVNPYEAQS